jgi:triosephosphate isomerase
MSSSRTPFVMGNWKMNLTDDEASKLIADLRPALDAMNGVETAVAPSFLSIPAAAKALQGSSIRLGAQNMHWDASGAQTGEISPAMLVAAGVTMVILGHSERRTLFGENDEMIGRKVDAAHTHGLTPVLCVGELESERDQGSTLEVVAAQVRKCLAGRSPGPCDLILAYEPVWAIGTGRTPTTDEVQEVHHHIRQELGAILGEQAAADIRILYGGSVNPGNAAEIFALPDVDGGLIGGAALKPEKFTKIAEST